jgi:site-specific recombinase XerD
MLSTMKTTPATRKQQKLIHVGDCLYRSSVTDVYYAIFTRDGRQVKRSLKTTDPELAKRRREEYRRKVERLTADDAKTLPFAEYDKDGKLIGGVAKHWFDAVAVSLKPHTVAMYLKSVRMLARRFGSLAVRSIGLRQIEQWAAQRSAECSARTYNADLEVLRRILDYACRHGLILENPAKEITRRKLSKEKITIPTKDQFRQVLETMRSNKGKRDGEQSADLVEFLAYSGCRRAEVAGDSAYGKPPMLWGDVNFELKTFTVAGKGAGELGKSRTVPLFPPLERLLLTLKSKLPAEPKASDRVFQIESAKKSLINACRELEISPHYTHHTMRHFFCSNAIEAGVDFKVIAGWLGHVDGGVLVAKTYGHLRDVHSREMAKRITFDAAAETPANVVPMRQTSS